MPFFKKYQQVIPKTVQEPTGEWLHFCRKIFIFQQYRNETAGGAMSSMWGGEPRIKAT